jgi:hypothetical protein
MYVLCLLMVARYRHARLGGRGVVPRPLRPRLRRASRWRPAVREDKDVHTNGDGVPSSSEFSIFLVFLSNKTFLSFRF